MLIATIISNTFDWVFWLMLGVFAELFEIPAIQADELELLFSSKDYSVLTKHTGPLCEWLETFGFSDGSGGERAGDVIYQKLRVSAMARSAVYISTMSSGDAELAIDDLACVIGTDKFQGSSFRAHGLAPPPAGEERKVAKHVAKIMVTSTNPACREPVISPQLMPWRSCSSATLTNQCTFPSLARCPRAVVCPRAVAFKMRTSQCIRWMRSVGCGMFAQAAVCMQ